MTSEPAVSVIIPAYNCERYLAEAIDSVLHQSFRDLEIILVNDGSTDNTRHVAIEYSSSLRYLDQDHSGSGAARNRGVESARGRFLAFLDADDLWTEDKVALQIAVFRESPETELVYGHVRQFRSSPSSINLTRQTDRADDALPGHVPGTMLIRRESFLRVGPFATTWRIGEGLDWYMRARDMRLNMMVLPRVLLWRRLHDDNQGLRDRGARTDYLHILKASLDRRRTGIHPPLNTSAAEHDPRDSAG